jgi:hypothetical protein
MEIKLDHEELTKTIMYTLIDLQVRLISIQDKLGISSDISSDLATLAKYSADEVANDHSGHMTSNDVIKVDPKVN